MEISQGCMVNHIKRESFNFKYVTIITIVLRINFYTAGSISIINSACLFLVFVHRHAQQHPKHKDLHERNVVFQL